MTRDLTANETAPTVQEEIFKTLLRTPHRSVDEVLAIHREQLERDPYLYGCLATYAVEHGECAVKDIQDIFVATMFVSEFSVHRSAAWAMLQTLPPYRVTRVLKYVCGYSEIVRHNSLLSKPMPEQGKFGVRYSAAPYGKTYHDEAKRGLTIPRKESKITRSLRNTLKGLKNFLMDRAFFVDVYKVSHDCHGKNLNRFAKGAVEYYLRYRERDENRSMMDGAMIRMRNHLRALYAKCHIRPKGWVERALFHNEIPEGSRLEALNMLSASTDPTEQAKIIMDARIPFPVASTLISSITPSVGLALISVMSPQEVLANVGSMKRRGFFDHPELKQLIMGRIKEIEGVKKGKVDALKGEAARKAVPELDDDVKQAITKVVDVQLKSYGEINIPTVLLVDKSASMSNAIELAKQVGATVAQACTKGNFAGCYLFNSSPVRLKWSDSDGDIGTKSAWDKKLEMHFATGRTDLDKCLRAMIEDNVRAEQIVIITDEGENGSRIFASYLPEYEEKFGFMPNIVIIRIGGRYNVHDKVEKSCRKAGADVDVLKADGIDSVAMPNLLQLLSRKSIFELIQEINQLSLPTREEWIKDHEAVGSSAAIA